MGKSKEANVYLRMPKPKLAAYACDRDCYCVDLPTEPEEAEDGRNRYVPDFLRGAELS